MHTYVGTHVSNTSYVLFFAIGKYETSVFMVHLLYVHCTVVHTYRYVLVHWQAAEKNQWRLLTAQAFIQVWATGFFTVGRSVVALSDSDSDTITAKPLETQRSCCELRMQQNTSAKQTLRML